MSTLLWNLQRSNKIEKAAYGYVSEKEQTAEGDIILL